MTRPERSSPPGPARNAYARRRIATLARDLRERTTTRQVLIRAGGAAAQRKFGDIEKEAGHVRSFSPAMVVGLLQTADYARSVFAGGLPPEQVDAAVSARLERQQLIESTGGPAFTQIVTEGALRWHVGSPELMAAQCDHLAEAATAHDRVRIGIIAWSRPRDFFAIHGFDLYDERAVIVGTAYLTAKADVGEYVALFAQLEAVAEFGDAVAAIAGRIDAEYRGL